MCIRDSSICFVYISRSRDRSCGCRINATRCSTIWEGPPHSEWCCHEFRIGRLKHERIKIPRDPCGALLRAAINALKFHATRKAILEIEFIDEEGTGLGPTLEFFSLIAAELQRQKLAIWYSDDKVQENELTEEQLASRDQNVIELYHFMGIFLAKSLQDQRLVDLPFSYPFLKILCSFNESQQQHIESTVLNLFY